MPLEPEKLPCADLSLKEIHEKVSFAIYIARYHLHTIYDQLACTDIENKILIMTNSLYSLMVCAAQGMNMEFLKKQAHLLLDDLIKNADRIAKNVKEDIDKQTH